MTVAHGGARRRRRAPARAAVRARRRRPLVPPAPPLGSPAHGAQAAAARAGDRRARALLDRVRGDRVVDLLRARRRRGLRARLHACGAARRRRLLRDRRALVRRGHDGDPRDRRRRHLRPEGVQRPRRLRHRLGALPRLRDRDRAVDAVRAALPRRRVRVRHAAREPVGHRRRGARDRGDRGVPLAAPLPPVPRRGGGRRRRPRHTGPARGARLRLDLLAGRARGGHRPRGRADVALDRVRAAARAPRLHRPRDGREPRRGDAAAGPDAAAEPLRRDRAHGRRSTPPSGSSRSPPSRPRATRTRSAATGCARRSWGSSTC